MPRATNALLRPGVLRDPVRTLSRLVLHGACGVLVAACLTSCGADERRPAATVAGAGPTLRESRAGSGGEVVSRNSVYSRVMARLSPSDDTPSEFRQLEGGLRTLSFHLYHAVGFPRRITAWSGGSKNDPSGLSGVEIGDLLSIGDAERNPPGVNVHTSLRINSSEEEIALVAIPIYPTARGEPENINLSLEETWQRKASATRVETRDLEIDGVPERWTVVMGRGAWAATRQHGNITVTVAGRGVDLEKVRLARVSDPTSLDRPQWTGQINQVRVEIDSQAVRLKRGT